MPRQYILLLIPRKAPTPDSPCFARYRWTDAKCSFPERVKGLRGRLEYWRVAPLWDAQDEWFVSSFFIEIFVKFESKLTGVHANRAVFEGTVTRGLVKQLAADLLFR